MESQEKKTEKWFSELRSTQHEKSEIILNIQGIVCVNSGKNVQESQGWIWKESNSKELMINYENLGILSSEDYRAILKSQE